MPVKSLQRPRKEFAVQTSFREVIITTPHPPPAAFPCASPRPFAASTK